MSLEMTCTQTVVHKQNCQKHMILVFVLFSANTKEVTVGA